jgi:hypothetical protein
VKRAVDIALAFLALVAIGVVISDAIKSRSLGIAFISIPYFWYFQIKLWPPPSDDELVSLTVDQQRVMNRSLRKSVRITPEVGVGTQEAGLHRDSLLAGSIFQEV